MTMTQARRSGHHVGDPVREPGFWMANIWLVFLAFPVLSVATEGNLSAPRRVAGILLLVGFGMIHALGYRTLIQREMQIFDHPPVERWPDRFHPHRSELWFTLLIVTLAAAFAVAGWGALGAMPFITTFSIFNFSWRTAGITVALCCAAVVLGPVLFGAPSVWFALLMILVIATVPSAIARVGEERQHDVNALQSQLMLSEERARMARDVHDVLGHSLTAIVLKTQVTDRMLAAIDDPTPEVAAARQQLAETQDVSRKALAEIRATVSGMRSADLVDELAAARSVLSDAGVSLVVTGDPSSVPHRHHQALGWTVREAVTNIVRHAGASSCTIELDAGPTLLTVSDDGAGIDGAREGNGLTGLRERLADADLALVVESGGSTGTTLNVGIA